MRTKAETDFEEAEKRIRDIRRANRRQHSAEEKIRAFARRTLMSVSGIWRRRARRFRCHPLGVSPCHAARLVAHTPEFYPLRARSGSRPYRSADQGKMP